jgi:spectinomycin phosphotransferase
VLIDWDTVGLARPERDLWFFGDQDEALAQYTEVSGRALDRRAITLYRDAWMLAELEAFLHVFRSVHETDEDTTHAWQVLQALTWSTDG